MKRRPARGGLQVVAGAWSQADWTSATAPLPGLSLMQTWEYGEARARTGSWEAHRLSIGDGARTLALVQVMTRRGPVGLGRLAWVSRGPLALEAITCEERIEILRALREHAVTRERSYLRVAPSLELSAVAPSELAASGFASTGAEGWSSARLDLSPSLADLRTGLHSKWRNALSRAERLGVEAVPVDLDVFIEAYEAEPPRPGYVKTLTGDLLRTWQELLPADRRLVALEARREGVAVSWILCARYGHAGEYLAAVNSPAARPLNANRLLLWESIRMLRADGRRSFDLGGLDPGEHGHGFSRFKAGVGGEPYKLGAEIDTDGPGVVNRGLRLAVRRSRG